MKMSIDSTKEPGDTKESEGTKEPGDTKESEGTKEPEDTKESEGTKEPENTDDKRTGIRESEYKRSLKHRRKRKVQKMKFL